MAGGGERRAGGGAADGAADGAARGAEGGSDDVGEGGVDGVAEVPEEDEFIEDAEQRSEDVQKERFEKAKAQHARLIQKLKSAYPLASDFLARLQEIGFSTDGLLEAEEDPAALDAAVSSSTQWYTRVRMHPVCVYAS